MSKMYYTLGIRTGISMLTSSGPCYLVMTSAHQEATEQLTRGPFSHRQIMSSNYVAQLYINLTTFITSPKFWYRKESVIVVVSVKPILSLLKGWFRNQLVMSWRVYACFTTLRQGATHTLRLNPVCLCIHLIAHVSSL